MFHALNPSLFGPRSVSVASDLDALVSFRVEIESDRVAIAVSWSALVAAAWTAALLTAA